MLVSTAVSLLLAATQPASSPQPSGTSAEDRAVVYFHQGMKDYKDGRFKEAISEFLKADHLKPGAALMYNVGQCYEKLGDPTNAIRYYRAYLDRDPAASDRKAVEATIRNLEAQQRGEAPPAAAPVAAAQKPSKPDPALEKAALISLEIGGGLLALGLISGAVAAVNSGAVSGMSRPIPPSQAGDVSGDISRAHDFGLAANIFFIGASVAFLSAGTFYLLSKSSGSHEKPAEGTAFRLTPAVSPAGVGLIAEGQF